MGVIQKTILHVLNPTEHDLVRGRDDHRKHHAGIVHEVRPGNAGLY